MQSMESTENNSEAQNSNNNLYTRDGTVDVYGRPAIQSSTGSWKASSFILVNQALTSVTYYGVYNNLVRYLVNVFHEGNAPAANHVNNWTGTSCMTALLGAFISDSYLGRFWTCGIFLFVNLLSMILLTMSATIPSLSPPKCKRGSSECVKASTKQSGFLYFSLYLGALGAGAYQPCCSSLGADQFDEENPLEKHKKPVYFNWFYMAMTIGSLFASIVVLYVQDSVSWSWGFGICAFALALSLYVYLCGTPFYRNHKPGGNPFVRVMQVFVAAIRKLREEVPSGSSRLLYEVEYDKTISGRRIVHTEKFRFLDKAATFTERDKPVDRLLADPWRLCTVTQVEEVKCIIRIVPVFISSIMYSLVYSQMATFFLEQGGTMDTHFGSFQIPPGSLSVFENLSIIIWTPAYERLLVPLFRKLTGNRKGLTDLQRIGTGMLVIMTAMVTAALVEKKRLQVARQNGMLDSLEPLPMSVFWLVPQYFLIGASEVFTFIGLIEFFYDQFPDTIRALGSAFQLVAVALGSYSSSLLVTLVGKISSKDPWISDKLNRGHLDYYYWMLAGATGCNFGIFLFCAYSYKNIETAPLIEMVTPT